MALGIDSALDCTNRASAIAQTGVDFVGRYYRKKISKWTPLSATEVAALHREGLAVVALWEFASDKPDYFSYSSGVDDGTSAYRQALQAGQPPQTPIYFAVDFDASSAAVAGPISDYFTGVRAGYTTIGQGQPAYSIGVYGSGRTCAWLASHGRATYTWMALSTKWADYDTYTSWNIKQGPGTTALAFDHDTDTSVASYGSF
jgi:peptidoglycan hydrolase-like protein with peptidoglycan-binding domain